MSNSIQDLEQQIMECWNVTGDLDMVTKYFLDDPKFAGKLEGETWDEMANKYFAIIELYQLKFETMWKSFEKVTEDYYANQR